MLTAHLEMPAPRADAKDQAEAARERAGSRGRYVDSRAMDSSGPWMEQRPGTRQEKQKKHVTSAARAVDKRERRGEAGEPGDISGGPTGATARNPQGRFREFHQQG